jgi:hypothetical protein
VVLTEGQDVVGARVFAIHFTRKGHVKAPNTEDGHFIAHAHTNDHRPFPASGADATVGPIQGEHTYSSDGTGDNWSYSPAEPMDCYGHSCDLAIAVHRQFPDRNFPFAFTGEVIGDTILPVLGVTAKQVATSLLGLRLIGAIEQTSPGHFSSVNTLFDFLRTQESF